MLDVFLDALLDSLKILGVVLVIYVLLSFIEGKISKHLSKNNQFSPLIGASFGLIPQCGFSVIASDLYIKRHITMGTLLAVFIACSDEALPIMLSHPSKMIMVLPLLGLKLVIGFIVGFIVDLILTREHEKVSEHIHDCHHEEEVHVGCCHHEIDNEEENKWHKHLVHPLIHSLKIFAYVFVINMLFGVIIYFLGEDNLKDFLSANKFFAPLYAVIIGVIPNCASSVILTELYVLGGISFGACLGGLCMNAGLGMIYLIKKKEVHKEALIIFGILFMVSLITGYITSLVIGF